MVKNEIIIIADYSQEVAFTPAELCDICGISFDFIQELMAYDIIQQDQAGTFGLAELQRIKTVLRLQRDLEVNLAGAALILDLLQELQELRELAALMERHS